jgi:hypothetical protein
VGGPVEQLLLCEKLSPSKNYRRERKEKKTVIECCEKAFYHRRWFTFNVKPQAGLTYASMVEVV